MIRLALALNNYLFNEKYRSSLEEKIEQLNKFTDSRRIIESKGMNIQEFVTLADQLEQTLVLTMKDENGTADIERLSENGSDISGMSGETKISMHVQQVNSRYYSVQSTVKVKIFLDSMWSNLQLFKLIIKFSTKFIS